MYKEEYIEKANIPKNFKIYESRDGMFTDRIGPYFIKGRYPEVILGMRIFEHHSNLNGVAHVVQLCVTPTRKYVNPHEIMQRCASLCMCFVRYVLFEFEHMFVHMFM